MKWFLLPSEVASCISSLMQNRSASDKPKYSFRLISCVMRLAVLTTLSIFVVMLRSQDSKSNWFSSKARIIETFESYFRRLNSQLRADMHFAKSFWHSNPAKYFSYPFIMANAYFVLGGSTLGKMPADASSKNSVCAFLQLKLFISISNNFSSACWLFFYRRHHSQYFI